MTAAEGVDTVRHDGTPSSAADARAAAEHAARASYGRILAVVAAASRDLALAEDALADAFEKALRTWPDAGIPHNPEGWLVTVARNRLRDLLRSPASRVSLPLLDDLIAADERDAAAIVADREAIPDRRLELLFVCAHPAIDPGIRTPLMLQTVLGFDAAQIGRAFAVPAATMAQRLVRAKRRIRDAGIPFVLPTRDDMPDRLTPVLEAIYGAYAIDWLPDAGTTGSDAASIADEARWLAVLLASLLETEPEAWGLAALLTFAQSRAPARDVHPWPPLDDQDPSLWDAGLIAEGRALLAGLGARRPARPLSARGRDPGGALRSSADGNTGCRRPRHPLPRPRGRRPHGGCPRGARCRRGARLSGCGTSAVCERRLRPVEGCCGVKIL